MTLLHVYFHLRNQQAFLRLLSESAERGGNSSSGALSTSGGKSWTKPSTMPAMTSIINERDWLGRTVLHLACSSTEPWSIEYVRMLLAQPAINVNILDIESHWTPLHRALYNGNLAAALLLLQRSDIDTSIKDCEGYTAFDLYNSTIANTKPADCKPTEDYELFTWGGNRNATLGLGDGDDRSHPEQVVIPRLEGTTDNTLFARFDPVMVKEFAMSKLHSAVVTSEPRANTRFCGFSSGGRLGPGQHSQYSLKTLSQLTQTITTVALGQDHTIVVTASGEVLSWGLNRFGQLGYIVETSHPGAEPIQSIPKKILGPLKRDVIVKGVAASRVASACWTANEVYTWGTNNGQLGYEKSNQGPQILPRLVAKVAQPVLSVALGDTAMACLLISQDVQLFWNSRHFKINFPQAFPSEISVYRPPQFVKDANVVNIATCNDTFAALSSNGELFTFTVPNPTEADAGKERTVVKPQRVWALRKQFSAVRDAALGADGSLIVCTESGHVFVRTRNVKQSSLAAAKAFKFYRIPYLQRVVQVHANSTGSFAALRQEYHPAPIEITGNSLAQDLGLIQPWLSQVTQSTLAVEEVSGSIIVDDDEEKEDVAVSRDGEKLRLICQLFTNQPQNASRSPFPFGADTEVQVGRFSFPVHSAILASRSRVLSRLLKGTKYTRDGTTKVNITYHPAAKGSHSCLVFNGIHPMAVLLFLDYIYTDNVVAVWDRRVAVYAGNTLKSLGVDPLLIRSETQTLSRLLEVFALSDALESHTKRPPAPSLSRDLRALHDSDERSGPCKADVILQLSDDKIRCHSVILRARSSFFADFFSDDTWTKKRWDEDGVITVQMTNVRRRTMDFVMKFIYCGGNKDFFADVDFVNTLDELLEFLFEVLSAANELLLDRLVTICSSILLHFATVNNACYLLTDATHYHAEQLVSSLQSYIAVNLELFLESQLLSDLPPFLIKELAAFIRSAQAMKSPVSRSSILVDAAMVQHREWLEQQDIPQPIIITPFKPRTSQLMTKATKPPPRKESSSKVQISPVVSSIPDDIFGMEEEIVPSLSLESKAPHPTPSRVASGWKGISAVPKADMKAIMAETAQSSQSPVAPSPGESAPRVYRPPQAERRKVQQVQASESPAPPSQVNRSPESPWRVQNSPQRPPIIPFPSLSNVSPAKSAATTRSTSSVQPGLGPVFAPTRQQQPQPPTSIRRTSGGSAWSLPSVQPVTVPTSSASGVSLVAIQQSQLEEGIAPAKPRRSLREIQEEEQARQAEADFLKWWHEEEERVRLQAETEVALLASPSKKGEGGGRKPKKASANRNTDAAAGSSRGGAPQAHGGSGRGRSRNKANAGPS